MQYLGIIIIVIFLTAQNYFQKRYSEKSSSPNVFLFSALSALCAMLFFILSAGRSLSFVPALLPWSAAFAVSYAACSISLVKALHLGSMALTNLMISYSLIIPTLYGILFLKDPITVVGYAGIFLLLVSLFFLNYEKNGPNHFSGKWLISVLIAFVGNGMCSTIQKMQQMNFSGGYKNEFMIIALALSSIALLIPGIKISASSGKLHKKEGLHLIKHAFPCGFCNGAVNLLVMLLTGLLPSAILFPTISAGGIVLSYIIAVLVFKEKLTRTQLLGYGLGILSVILLNL